MKTAFLTAVLGLLMATGAVAQSKTPTPPPREAKPLLAVVTSNKADAEVVVRANRLTDRMAQQLRLNNYQTAKLRAINREKVSRMMEIERRHAADPKRVDADCNGVCRERDQELKALLSTAQYADYYESRPDFYKYDKQFLTRNATANARASAETGYTIPGMAPPVEVKGSVPAPVLKQSAERP